MRISDWSSDVCSSDLLAACKGRVPVELIGRSPFPPIGELSYFITLPAYGFYWFLLAQEAEAPAWHESYMTPLPELRTLVLPEGWRSLVAGAPRETLEQRILPAFLPNQRWFGAKDVGIDAIRLGPHAAQIGRASCRERVCQYVYIPGVA